MKAPIATFDTIDIEKLVAHYAVRSNPLAGALTGLTEEDTDLEGTVGQITFRARDIVAVQSADVPTDLIQDLKETSKIEITNMFAVRLNPQTTGLDKGFIILNCSLADFILWWNEFGS